MNKAILALAGTLLTASPLFADGVDKSQVPAGTPFLVHLDLEGLLDSTVGKIILERVGDELLSESGLSEIEEELGINPLEDIKSITIFSTGGSMEHGVALVRCTARIEQAFERLHEIQTRILLLTAERSELRHYVKMQHEQLQDSEFHEIEGAGHFVPQDKPDEVMEYALKHLAE